MLYLLNYTIFIGNSQNNDDRRGTRPPSLNILFRLSGPALPLNRHPWRFTPQTLIGSEGPRQGFESRRVEVHAAVIYGYCYICRLI